MQLRVLQRPHRRRRHIVLAHERAPLAKDTPSCILKPACVMTFFPASSWQVARALEVTSLKVSSGSPRTWPSCPCTDNAPWRRPSGPSMYAAIDHVLMAALRREHGPREDHGERAQQGEHGLIGVDASPARASPSPPTLRQPQPMKVVVDVGVRGEQRNVRGHLETPKRNESPVAMRLPRDALHLWLIVRVPTSSLWASFLFLRQKRPRSHTEPRPISPQSLLSINLRKNLA